MGRRLRFIPENGALVEVTCRTLQGRFLLKPTRELVKIVIGVLAKAQELYGVDLHAFVFLSNHYHLLLSVVDARQLARFMNYVNSNLAREAGRIQGWSGKFWARRYQAIVVSQEEAAQLGRIRYLLSHGCKEGLVGRPQDWPGANCVRSLTEGRSLEGLWFDRTRESAAKARGEAFHRRQFALRKTLKLEPLPCWSDCSVDEYQQRIRKLVLDIEAETAALHARERTRPAGVEKVMARDPHTRPHRLKRAVAPSFHAATRSVREELIRAYRRFVAEFRAAAKALRDAEFTARFPQGCFPPRLPFVDLQRSARPG